MKIYNSKLLKFEKKKAGIFFDDSNLFYAQKKVGWKVDVKRLKRYFSKTVNLKVAKYYIAIPDKNDVNYKATLKYIEKINKDVYIVSNYFG